ncbi:MAG: cation transporter [Parcubacteria group bacterium]|nr:cation transporter [Parcubacteria group bacterium]
MGATYFPLVVGVTGVSALLSMVLGRYQIYVGKKIAHESLVADGIETLSDGRIEVVTFVGVIGEYFFRTPVIEYPLGFLVAYFVFHTGREIATKGWNALLQKSIGREHEEYIQKRVESIPGVLKLAQLKTFQAGERVICIMKVITRSTEQTNIDIKHTIAHHVVLYFKKHAFEESEFFIRFDRPTPHNHRVAYGIERVGGATVISKTLMSATHVRICDVEDEDIVRWKDEPLPRGSTFEEAIKLLIRKRVKTFFACGNEPCVKELKGAGIGFHKTLSSHPEALGIQ